MTPLMKIVLCGDDGTGKDLFRKQYCGKTFDSQRINIKGLTFMLKEQIFEGRALKFQIWDMKDRLDEVRSVCYLGSLGAIVLFDVRNPKSFEKLEYWINEIFTHTGSVKIPIAVIGNRIDQSGDYPDALTDERVLKYCEELSNQNSTEVTYYSITTEVKDKHYIDYIFENFGKKFFSYLEKSTRSE